MSDNRPQEVCEVMETQYGLKAEIALKRLAGREKQFILKFRK